MNLKFLILFTLLILPVASAADTWNLHFDDGTTTINATDVCLSTGVCITDSTGNSSFNQILADTMYANINASGDNSSFNQTLADTMYGNINLTAGNLSWNQSLGNNLYASINITADNTSWTQILADSMYANINLTAGNLSWNESYAITLFNRSWNQTYADTLYILQTNEGVLNVNSSVYWYNYNQTNTTWFENIGGALSIKISQLTTWADAWLGTKDTDDLAEGTVNLYDNSSWNETYADTLYLTGQLALFFYNNSDSFNNSYTIMNTTINPNIQSDTFTSLGDGDNLLAKRILSTLDISIMESGAYNQHTTINYTAGTKDVQLKSTIHVLLANGTEVQIGSSPISPTLSTSTYQQIIWTGVINNETIFSTGDYLTMYLYAVVSGGGGAPTLELVVGGDTAARLDIGINPTDIAVLGDNASFNQILTDTMYGNINLTAGNLSWNQSLGNDLYASINLTGDNTSWNQILGDTLYANLNITAGNLSWNQSLGNNLYANINDTNTSWTEVYADDLYRESVWNNFTGIPTATPSVGDTTHLTTSKQVFDWVMGLGFFTANDYTNLALTNISETFEINVTMNELVFNNSVTNSIRDNATCVILGGSTSRFEVC